MIVTLIDIAEDLIQYIAIPWILVYLVYELIKLKQLTIKNQIVIMAQLTDFQQVIADINTATQNISTYVQGTGMSSTDQDTVLQQLKDAVSNLNAAIPAPTAPAQ